MPLNPVKSFTIVISTAVSDLSKAAAETLSCPIWGCLQSCQNAPSKQWWDYLLHTIPCPLPGCRQTLLHFYSQAPSLLLWGRAQSFPTGTCKEDTSFGFTGKIVSQQSLGLNKAITPFLSFPGLFFFSMQTSHHPWRAPHLVSARLLLLVWHPLFTKQTQCSF